MSDTLREALEELAEQYEADARVDDGLAYYRVSGQLRELLSAHPVEPAETPCNCGFGGFHDDANPRCDRNAEAASTVRGIAEGGGAGDQVIDVSPGAFMEIGPSTFVPALPDEIRDAARDGIEGAAEAMKRFEAGAWVEGFAEDLANGALEAVAPLLGLQQVPSREEIAGAIHEATLNHLWGSSLCMEPCRSKHLRRASAVLALFSKPAGEPQCICRMIVDTYPDPDCPQYSEHVKPAEEGS